MAYRPTAGSPVPDPEADPSRHLLSDQSPERRASAVSGLSGAAAGSRRPAYNKRSYFLPTQRSQRTASIMSGQSFATSATGIWGERYARRRNQTQAMADFVEAVTDVMEVESVRQRILRLSEEGTEGLSERLRDEICATTNEVGRPRLMIVYEAYAGDLEQEVDNSDAQVFFQDYADAQLKFVPPRLAAFELSKEGIDPNTRFGRAKTLEQAELIRDRMRMQMAETRWRWFEMIDTDHNGLLSHSEFEDVLLGSRAKDFARLTLAVSSGEAAVEDDRVPVFALASGGFSEGFDDQILMDMASARRCAMCFGGAFGRFLIIVACLAAFTVLCGGWMAVWLLHSAWYRYPDTDPGGDCWKFRTWSYVMAFTCFVAGFFIAIGGAAVEVLRLKAGRRCFAIAAPVPLFAASFLVYGQYLDKWGDLDECSRFRDSVQVFLFAVDVICVLVICFAAFLALQESKRNFRVERPARLEEQERLLSQESRLKHLEAEARINHSQLREEMLRLPTVTDKMKGSIHQMVSLGSFSGTAQKSLGNASVQKGDTSNWMEKQDQKKGFSWDEWAPVGQRIQMRDEERGEATFTLAFGSLFRQQHMLLSKNFLNSASYGATPKAVLMARQSRMEEMQQNPVQWRFGTLRWRLLEATRRLASFLSADPENVSILHNANAATSTVFKSLPWEPGDRILVFSVEYDATLLACHYLERTYGVEVCTLDLVMPMTDKEVVHALTTKLKQMEQEPGGLPKLCNFCHVTSGTAWIFPAAQIVSKCHEYGVSVLCDGAQAPGHLPDLNVQKIAADWYIGTVHKWMFSCPGVAFIVTEPHKQKCTFPLTVSYFDKQGYAEEFSYTGLQDWSVWFSLIDGLDFVEKVCNGWPAVWNYQSKQVKEMIDEVSKIWTNKGLRGPWWLEREHEIERVVWCQPLQGRKRYGSMPLLPLPWASRDEAEQAHAENAMLHLGGKSITAFVKVVKVRGKDGKVYSTLAIRCACQIYTDISDWTAMASAIAELNGEYTRAAAILGGVSMLTDMITMS